MSVADRVRRRLDPEERYGLRLTLIVLALVIVAVPFGWLLNQVEGEGFLVDVDTDAADDLHGWARSSPTVADGLRVLTALGAPLWLFSVVAVAAVALWFTGRRRSAAFLVMTAAVGGLINTAVKMAVNRPRPSLFDPVATADGRSFPSGHAMSSTVVYGALLLVVLPLVARRLRPVALAVAVALVAGIGFSRLALGVHFISDVIGGHVLGLAWLLASVAAFRLWRLEDAAEPPDEQAEAGEASEGRSEEVKA